jgi:uncharacterized membrane protein YhaH (DUF805 family)
MNNAISLAYRNAFVYKARSRRLHYWLFVLYSYVIYTFLNFALGSAFTAGTTSGLRTALNLILSIFLFYTYLATLACAIRRLHDAGKSGWFILVPIYNLYLLVQPSVPHLNQWGDVPNLVGMN